MKSLCRQRLRPALSALLALFALVALFAPVALFALVVDLFALFALVVDLFALVALFALVDLFALFALSGAVGSGASSCGAAGVIEPILAWFPQ
jgi:hypothetical protein